MTRLILFAAFTAVAVGCQANNAEVSCGKTLCAPNQRCEPTQLICVLDEPPKIEIDAPAPEALIAGDTLSLRGSVKDDNGAKTLELSTDDGHTWVKVPLTGERFDARVALPTMDYQPFALTLRAHDSHQQGASAQVKVTIDNVAPQLTVTAPVDGTRLNAAWFAGPAAVSGLAIDGSGLVSLTVDVGDGVQAVAVSGDQFAQPWPAPAGEDAVLHHVRVTATDLAGNQTVVEQAVTVDVLPPTVAFVTPAGGALLGTSFFQGGGLLRGTVSAGADVAAAFGGVAQKAIVSGTGWSIAYPAPLGIDFLPQVLEVVATDEAGNETHARQMVTVDVVPPMIAFAAPAQGAKLNAASFSSGDDIAVSWVVSDGDSQVVVRNGTTDVGASPLKVATAATDNPKSYSVTLTAEDRAGNTATATLSFAVDRVCPTVVSRRPVDGSRNNAASAAIDFSEAVSGGDGLTLTPPVSGGTWMTPTHFEVNSLPADSVFSVAVGTLSDGFGNPATIPAVARFHTAPMLPPSGTSLMTDVWHFKAVADPDGVLSIFTTSQTSPAGYRWVRVNPRTSAIEDNRMPWLPTTGGAFAELDAYAWSSVNADLSARRVAAAMTLHLGPIAEHRVWTRFDDATATSDLGMVGLIPTAAFAAEGILGEVGYLRISSNVVSYTRVGMSSELGIGIGSPTALGYGDRRWELVEVRNQTFKRRSYGCVRYFANQPPSCEFTAIAQWTDVASTDNTSYAMTDACSVVIYDANTGSRVMRVEPYAPNCLGTCPAGASTPYPLASELRVAADRRAANSFVGAQRTVGGVQVMRLPLSSACAGSWANVGAAVPVPAGASFEPVSLGGKPALLYVDSGNVLKLVTP